LNACCNDTTGRANLSRLNEAIVCAAGALQMIEVRLTIDERPVTTTVATDYHQHAGRLDCSQSFAGGPMLRQG